MSAPATVAYKLRETPEGTSVQLDLVDESGEVVAHCELFHTDTATWHLSHLWVLERLRRKGLGTRVLEAACAAADAGHARLELIASAYPSYPDPYSGRGGLVALDQEGLEAFYRRRGFEDIGGCTFRRPPH